MKKARRKKEKKKKSYVKLRKFRFEKLGRELRKNGKEKAKSGENKMEKEITWIE